MTPEWILKIKMWSFRTPKWSHNILRCYHTSDSVKFSSKKISSDSAILWRVRSFRDVWWCWTDDLSWCASPPSCTFADSSLSVGQLGELLFVKLLKEDIVRCLTIRRSVRSRISPIPSNCSGLMPSSSANKRQYAR
jgi:hypothetical protein